ncbi:hypothetical protein A0J61_06073 [Choanephora cucurbitarum]|uniref:Uncharacterized protein n=1 Tax=Choanephora cucurbitarum TaxID=101091 RepID=A0A1C7N9S0_9FUNG|nr:hypothetical protein A0J61_06073 [Choanephora cucurbitarum]
MVEHNQTVADTIGETRQTLPVFLILTNLTDPLIYYLKKCIRESKEYYYHVMINNTKTPSLITAYLV